MKRAAGGLAAVVAAVLLVAAVTLLALEGREVIVLRTHAADGSVRETRTWVAEDGGALWVEAAVPERPFFQQLLADPTVEVVRGGQLALYRATPVPNPAGHVRIRKLLAKKYGWADWWIGWLTDTSQSVAIKLEPLSG